MKLFFLLVLTALAVLILATTDRGLYLLRWVAVAVRHLALWGAGAVAIGGVVASGFLIGGWVAIFIPLALAALVVRALFGIR